MGRKTIEDVLRNSIALLKSGQRIHKIQAGRAIYQVLSVIKNFEPKLIALLNAYPDWMMKRYQTVFVVGIKKRLKELWIAFMMRKYMNIIINQCEAMEYGDGDKYIKDILKIIRKDIN